MRSVRALAVLLSFAASTAVVMSPTSSAAASLLAPVATVQAAPPGGATLALPDSGNVLSPIVTVAGPTLLQDPPLAAGTEPSASPARAAAEINCPDMIPADTCDAVNGAISNALAVATECLDGTRANCSDAVRDVQALAGTITALLSNCASGNEPVCATVLTAASEALAEATDCLTLSRASCSDAVRDVSALAAAVATLALNCANGNDPTCNLAFQLASDAIALVEDCLSGTRASCADAVRDARMATEAAVATALACASGSEPLCATLFAAVDNGISLVSECLDAARASCSDAVRDAKLLAESVIELVNACAAGSDALCRTVQDAANDAVALVNECLAATRASCSDALRDANAAIETAIGLVNLLVDLAEGAVAECLDDYYGTCQTVLRAAEALVDECMTDASSLCQTTLQVASGLVDAAVDAATQCAAAQSGPCADAAATAESLISAAETAIAECTDSYSGTCQTLLRQASALAGDVVAVAAGAVNTAIATVESFDPGDASGGATRVQVTTPAGFNEAANDDPTWVDVWDFAEPPADTTVADETILAAEEAALDATIDQVELVGQPDDCRPEWHYDPDKTFGKKATWRPGTEIENFNNDDDSDAEMRIERAASGKRGVTATVGVEAGAGVIVAKVKSTFQVSGSLEQSWSNTVGHSHVVKAHRLGHLGNGVLGWKTRGHYYHTNSKCNIDIDKGVATTWVPYANAWGYWSEPAATTEPDGGGALIEGDLS